MGFWSITDVRGEIEDLADRPAMFGSQFTLSVQLSHRPSAADLSSTPPPFNEPPRLEWNERIITKNISAGEYWEWENDLYSFQPNAATFKAWRQRYIEAYRRAVEMPSDYGRHNGSSELRVNGVPVTRDQLLGAPPAAPAATISSRLANWSRFGRRSAPAQASAQPLSMTNLEKAEVVRRFIQTNTCELCVEILDRPALGLNTNAQGYATMKKERLLLFDCGFGAQKVKAYQHLMVDVPAGKQNWVRSAGMGWINLPMDYGTMIPVIADPQQFQGNVTGYVSHVIDGEYS